jgi:hypothetical protein
MVNYVKNQLEGINQFIIDTTKGSNLKDKNIDADVKVLIGVKENVESVFRRNDEIILELDSLDEALNMLNTHGLAKEAQIKMLKKLLEDWNILKKLAKAIKSDISNNVNIETEKNANQIKRLEDELRVFTNESKKRDYYQYKAGVSSAHKSLDSIDIEIVKYETRIEDLGFNAEKFCQHDLISNSHRSTDNIKFEVTNMRQLWNHI